MEGDPEKYPLQTLFSSNRAIFAGDVCFENVPGLLTAGGGSYLTEILSGFRERGYELEYHILNAADYGVLQNRKRIILIGWRTDTKHVYPKLKPTEKKYFIADILEDLPSLEPGQKKDKYASARTEYLQDTNLRTKNDILTWHVARTNLERDREIYRLAAQLWKNGHKRLKYTDIPVTLATHNNRTSFLDRFKVVADDLPASHTMVAHISKDGHYYIHPDAEQARSLSVREAARVQSFPDNFISKVQGQLLSDKLEMRFPVTGKDNCRSADDSIRRSRIQWLMINRWISFTMILWKRFR